MGHFRMSRVLKINRSFAITVGFCMLISCSSQQNQKGPVSNVVKPDPINKAPKTIPLKTSATTAPAKQTFPKRDLVKKNSTKPIKPKRKFLLPATLIGLTDEKISTLLGAPAFIRRDPPSQFWRYRSGACVLELVFYRKSGTLRVNHVSTRANAEASVSQPRCSARFQKQG